MPWFYFPILSPIFRSKIPIPVSLLSVLFNFFFEKCYSPFKLKQIQLEIFSSLRLFPFWHQPVFGLMVDLATHGHIGPQRISKSVRGIWAAIMELHDSCSMKCLKGVLQIFLVPGLRFILERAQHIPKSIFFIVYFKQLKFRNIKKSFWF